MGTPLHDAAESLLNMAAKFEHIQAVASALRDVGSLDAALKERKEAIAKATEEKAAIDAETAKAKENLSTLTVKIKNQVLAANTKADETIDTANAKAEKVMSDANTYAKTIEARSHEEAAKITDGAKADLVILLNNKTSLETSIAELKSAAKQAQDDLDGITAKVNALKSTIVGAV